MSKPIATIIARMKHYITASGANIIIGRNSRENEQLTFQIAKAHDLWFHANNTQGAHVLLISPNNNHHPDDIQYAANLAALHSKIKKIFENDKQKQYYTISVNYCKAIDVFKQSFAPRGTVLLENYNIINAIPYDRLSKYNIHYDKN
jgi:predicted ribosome quality control (RQC) complex YloA/Tae2 family protein